MNVFIEKKGLKIFHQNVRGLFTNFTFLQKLFKECKNIYILSLSETHINGYNNNNELYQIHGYDFVQRNRKHGKGGGVAVYLKDIQWNRRFDLEKENVEKIWIEIFGTAERIAMQPRPLNVLYNKQQVNNTTITMIIIMFFYLKCFKY